MRGTSKHRKLGLFVLGIAIWQALIYVMLATGPDEMMWLFYLDPRIGWAFMATLLGESEMLLHISSWFSAALTFLVGAMLLRRNAHIKTYVIAESFLALPTFAFLVVIIASNIRPVHGFSIGELAVPIIVFLMVSVIPMAATLVALSRAPANSLE